MHITPMLLAHHSSLGYVGESCSLLVASVAMNMFVTKNKFEEHVFFSEIDSVQGN